MEAVARDWRDANLAAADAALCRFAERLTMQPGSMGLAQVEELRAVGFDDTAIHDSTQVIGYFNYINRIADALGVEMETFVRAWGEDSAE